MLQHGFTWTTKAKIGEWTVSDSKSAVFCSYLYAAGQVYLKYRSNKVDFFLFMLGFLQFSHVFSRNDSACLIKVSTVSSFITILFCHERDAS